MVVGIPGADRVQDERAPFARGCIRASVGWRGAATSKTRGLSERSSDRHELHSCRKAGGLGRMRSTATDCRSSRRAAGTPGTRDSRCRSGSRQGFARSEPDPAADLTRDRRVSRPDLTGPAVDGRTEDGDGRPDRKAGSDYYSSTVLRDPVARPRAALGMTPYRDLTERLDRTRPLLTGRRNTMLVRTE